jgi:leucine dehydrogenase
MDTFGALFQHGYESLVHCADPATGLRAIVCVHDSTLGPALGGCRALPTYANEEAAATDALRLARGMTYKASLAGLDHGGGKSVIWLPSGPFERAPLFQAFARAVDRLGGYYITTEDSGTSPADMEVVRRITRHVVGAPASQGGSGDPSPMTAFGVLRGIEAAVAFKLKRAGLDGLTVAIQGLGHVGFPLARHLRERGAKLIVHDINRETIARARDELKAEVAPDDEALFGAAADVLAPCALGGAIGDRTLGKLRVQVVAGAANNQLAEPRHGEALQQRGILYAPDYAINAGGLINVAQEIKGYDAAAAKARTSAIHDTLTMIFERAAKEGARPEQVADRLAEERIAFRRRERGLPERRAY